MSFPLEDCPRIYILSAPSGGGKSSIAKAVSENNDNIIISISHTTRPKKTGEEDGKDYFFVDEVTFKDMINSEEFIEYAEVFGNYYGTSKKSIKNFLDKGINVILDIDWQGASLVRKNFPNAISIYILPPSIEVLKDRLINRDRDSEGEINLRLAEAASELSHHVEYDYLIVNHIFDQAVGEIAAIIKDNIPPKSAVGFDLEALVNCAKIVKLKVSDISPLKKTLKR